MISSFTHLLSPIISLTPYPLPSTNTAKLILTIMCACAPLPSTHVLTLTHTYALFTLRSAVWSEIADDQPSRLAPCPLQYWQIDAFITRFSFIWTTDNSCSSPHPQVMKLEVMNKMRFSFASFNCFDERDRSRGYTVWYMRPQRLHQSQPHYWFWVCRRPSFTSQSHLTLQVSASY